MEPRETRDRPRGDARLRGARRRGVDQARRHGFLQRGARALRGHPRPSRQGTRVRPLRPDGPRGGQLLPRDRAYRGSGGEARESDLRRAPAAQHDPAHLRAEAPLDPGETRGVAAGRHLQPADPLGRPPAHTRRSPTVLPGRLRPRGAHQRVHRRSAGAPLGALEANLSLISIRQNDIMKKLASWAGILAVPTLLVGIWGMNFETMPELHLPFAYPL